MIISKKFLYHKFLMPIIGFFIKNFFLSLTKKYIKSFRLNTFKGNSFIFSLINIAFYEEYFLKLKDQTEIKEIEENIFVFSKKHHIEETNSHYKNFSTRLQNKDFFEFIFNFINKHKIDNILQVGSSGGLDLNNIYENYNDKKYIFTDINEEIIKLGKERHGDKFSYFKCFGHKIDECLSHYNIKNNILIFSIGASQYMTPFQLKKFFENLRNYKNSLAKNSEGEVRIYIIFIEPVELDFLEQKKMYSIRKHFAFNYKYKEFAERLGCKIKTCKIIEHHQSHKLKYFRNIATYCISLEI